MLFRSVSLRLRRDTFSRTNFAPGFSQTGLDLLHLKDSHPVVLAFVRFMFKFIIFLRTSPALKPKGKTGVLLFRVSDTLFGTRKTERCFGKGVKEVCREAKKESGSRRVSKRSKDEEEEGEH